jgi:hypothetical protein
MIYNKLPFVFISSQKSVLGKVKEMINFTLIYLRYFKSLQIFVVPISLLVLHNCSQPEFKKTFFCTPSPPNPRYMFRPL